MVDISTYYFKPLTDKKVKPKESFINFYVDECLDSKGTISSTRGIRRILDAKGENSDLTQVMEKKYQPLSPNKQERLLHILRKFEILFNGTLGPWKTAPVYLEL